MEVKILVTGGAGFIGSHVSCALLKDGHEVIILDDLSGGFNQNLPEGSEFIRGSITDEDHVDQIFEDNKIDYVFHLAAYAAEGLSHFIRRFNYTNNLIGSVNLINNAIRHECKCFVFMSSIAVYGAGQVPMVEDQTPQPEDPYGISKYAVELDLAAAHKMFGLPYIVFRTHNVYGEGQNIGDPYRNVIGIFMNQILQQKPCTIFGDGKQRRAFTHVSDIAPVIAASIDNPEAYNGVFNLGSDQHCTVNVLAIKVQEAMGAYFGEEYLPSRKEVLNAFSDHEKAKRILGYKSKVSLYSGLCLMADWVKSVGARQGKPFEGIEVERNLPESWKRRSNA
jgi:UDP-glucose 4-epimerase